MAAKYGYGSILEADTGASNAYVAIADILNIHFPSQEVSKVDITSITQSTNYKQHSPGMREGGTLSVEVYWSAAAFSTIIALLGVTHNFRVTMNDATPTKYAYSGFIDKVGDMVIEADKAPMFKIEVCVLGAVTIS